MARIGRGGKRGTTSGRGTKGQKSRSGHVIRPAERDLLLKLPKKRGFRNKPDTKETVVFNIGRLSEVLSKRGSDKGTLVVDKLMLIEAGLIPKRFRGNIKILGRGDSKFKIEFKGLKLSKSASEKNK